MGFWNDIKDKLKDAISIVQENPVLDAFARTALESVPVVGSLLVKLYENSEGKPEDKTRELLQLLKNMEQMNEQKFEEYCRKLDANQNEILINRNYLKQLVSETSTILKEVEQIETKVDKLDSKLNEIQRVEEERWRRTLDALQKLQQIPAYGGFGTDALAQRVRTREDLTKLYRTPLQGKGVLGEVFVGTLPLQTLVSPKRMEAYVTNFGENNVSIIDCSTLREKVKIGVGQQPSALALSSDGARLYVGNNGGGVSVIDMETRQLLHSIPTPGPVRDLAITHDGRKIFLALEYLGLGKLELDTQTESVRIISSISCPEGVAVTPDDGRLYVSYQCTGPGGFPGHDAIGVFDVKREELIDSIKDLPNVGGAIEISPDGNQVWINGSDACIAASYDHRGCPFVPGGVINVIETESNKLKKTLGIPPEWGTGMISFSRDSALALVGGNYSKIIDTETFVPITVMDLPLSGSAVSAPDGRQFYAPAPIQNRVVLLELS